MSNVQPKTQIQRSDASLTKQTLDIGLWTLDFGLWTWVKPKRQPGALGYRFGFEPAGERGARQPLRGEDIV
jgi:hypothetical protein